MSASMKSLEAAGAIRIIDYMLGVATDETADLLRYARRCVERLDFDTFSDPSAQRAVRTAAEQRGAIEALRDAAAASPSRPNGVCVYDWLNARADRIASGEDPS